MQIRLKNYAKSGLRNAKQGETRDARRAKTEESKLLKNMHQEKVIPFISNFGKGDAIEDRKQRDMEGRGADGVEETARVVFQMPIN